MERLRSPQQEDAVHSVDLDETCSFSRVQAALYSNQKDIACSFLTALCSMEYGVYIFFGLVQLTAALFVYFLLPETVGVPIEMVSSHLRQLLNED